MGNRTLRAAKLFIPPSSNLPLLSSSSSHAYVCLGTYNASAQACIYREGRGRKKRNRVTFISLFFRRRNKKGNRVGSFPAALVRMEKSGREKVLAMEERGYNSYFVKLQFCFGSGMKIRNIHTLGINSSFVKIVKWTNYDVIMSTQLLISRIFAAVCLIGVTRNAVAFEGTFFRPSHDKLTTLSFFFFFRFSQSEEGAWIALWGR